VWNELHSYAERDIPLESRFPPENKPFVLLLIDHNPPTCSVVYQGQRAGARRYGMRIAHPTGEHAFQPETRKR